MIQGAINLVGVLRLRGKCAARNFHFAQDDRGLVLVFTDCL
jgi:hypothetical protein